MKFLHLLNCFLYFVNALLWATVANLYPIAVLWGTVAVLNLYYIRHMDNQGGWA